MLLPVLRALLRSVGDAVVPFELVCPITGEVIRRPAEWCGGNIPNVNGSVAIETGAVYDYEALVTMVVIKLKRGEAGARWIRTDTPACREMSRRISEWRAMYEWRDSPVEEMVLPSAAQPVPFTSSPSAQDTVKREIGRMLVKRPLQYDEEHLMFDVFGGTMVDDRWQPTSAMLAELLIRVVWRSSPALRFRVYGEFAQMISPQLRYEELGQLPQERKTDVETALRQEANSNPKYVPFDDFLWRMLMRFAREQRLNLWKDVDFCADYQDRWRGAILMNYLDAQK